MIVNELLDTQVPPKVSKGMELFYDYFSSNLDIQDKNYVHAWPSVSEDIPESNCEEYMAVGISDMYLATIINCGWDFAGSFLNHYFKGVNSSLELAPKETNWQDKGIMREFSQTEFVDRKIWEWNGFAETGYVFYPNQCIEKDAKCKVHINLHGCG